MVSLAARRHGGAPLSAEERAASRAAATARAAAAAAKGGAGLGFLAPAPLSRGTVAAAAPSESQANALAARAFLPLAEALAQQPAAGQARGSAAKRVAGELRELASGLPDNIHIYPGVATPVGGAAAAKSGGGGGGGCDRFLRALLVGRPGGAYAGRAVQVLLELPPDYPFRAPRATVETPVYHYAVSTAGGACLPALLDGWSPARSLRSVLLDLEGLLFDPATADPTAELAQRSMLSDLLRTDPTAYRVNAEAHAQAHAKAVPKGATTASLHGLLA